MQVDILKIYRKYRFKWGGVNRKIKKQLHKELLQFKKY